MNLFKNKCDAPHCLRNATNYIKLNRKGKYMIIKHCNKHNSIALEVLGADYSESNIFRTDKKRECKHRWIIAAEIFTGKCYKGNYYEEKRIGSLERCTLCKKVREKIY